jgi:hypothetical protein
MKTKIAIWAVYDHPKDFPDCFVARKHEADDTGYWPTPNTVTSMTLEGLRRQLRMKGLTPIARDVTDDPKIVESWL